MPTFDSCWWWRARCGWRRHGCWFSIYCRHGCSCWRCSIGRPSQSNKLSPTRHSSRPAYGGRIPFDDMQLNSKREKSAFQGAFFGIDNGWLSAVKKWHKKSTSQGALLYVLASLSQAEVSQGRASCHPFVGVASPHHLQYQLPPYPP